MTQSKPGKAKWKDISTLAGEEGREDEQGGWQRFVGRKFEGVTILDVGAGLGQSRQRLEGEGFCRNLVTLQDVAPGLPVDVGTPLEGIAETWDLVTAFDVIEHVADDLAFFAQLCRIARRFVFVSTPNEAVSHAYNSHHVREYTPAELMALAGGRPARWFAGSASGDEVEEMTGDEFVGHRRPHHAMLLNVGAGRAA